jgi:hypothetical protein
MRFFHCSLFFALLFAGPGAFAPVPGDRDERDDVTIVTAIQRSTDSVVLFFPRHAVTFVTSSRFFGGLAYGQDTTELSLNAQLLSGARHDDEALVRRALEAGAVPDSRNRAGDTALMIFIRKGNATMADLLLGKGADVNLATSTRCRR